MSVKLWVSKWSSHHVKGVRASSGSSSATEAPPGGDGEEWTLGHFYTNRRYRASVLTGSEGAVFPGWRIDEGVLASCSPPSPTLPPSRGEGISGLRLSSIIYCTGRVCLPVQPSIFGGIFSSAESALQGESSLPLEFPRRGGGSVCRRLCRVPRRLSLHPGDSSSLEDRVYAGGRSLSGWLPLDQDPREGGSFHRRAFFERTKLLAPARRRYIAIQPPAGESWDRGSRVKPQRHLTGSPLAGEGGVTFIRRCC